MHLARRDTVFCMPAFLLLWDRDPNSWSSAKRDYQKSRKGRPIEVNWSSGSRKAIPVGGRVFLKRTGAEVRGILAAGFTTAPVFADSHWREDDKSAHYVPATFDVVLDPFGDELLPQTARRGRWLDGVHWDTQGGGMMLSGAQRALGKKLGFFANGAPSGGWRLCRVSERYFVGA